MLFNKQSYKVLDLFHGEGKLWDKIKKDGYDITITGVDIKRGIDNRKLKGFADFSKYDVFDFDSYGDSLERMLCYIDEIKEGAIVFATLITIMHNLSRKTTEGAGIDFETSKYCPTLWGENEVGEEIIKSILSRYTDKYYLFSPTKKKSYIAFKKTKTPKKPSENTLNL